MNKHQIIFIISILILITGIILDFSGVNTIAKILLITGVLLAIYQSVNHKKKAVTDYVKLEKEVEKLEKNNGSLKSRVSELQEKLIATEKINKVSQRHLGDIQNSSSKDELATTFITTICDDLDASMGAFFLVNDKTIEYSAGFAYKAVDEEPPKFGLGEGLVGQSALDQKPFNLKDIPEDYVEINSGLGKAQPKNVFIQPIVYHNETLAVFELATFSTLSDQELTLLNLISDNIATKLSSFKN